MNQLIIEHWGLISKAIPILIIAGSIQQLIRWWPSALGVIAQVVIIAIVVFTWSQFLSHSEPWIIGMLTSLALGSASVGAEAAFKGEKRIVMIQTLLFLAFLLSSTLMLDEFIGSATSNPFAWVLVFGLMLGWGAYVTSWLRKN